MTIKDNKDCIKLLLYFYFTTIAGRGLLLMYSSYILNPETPPLDSPYNTPL